MPSVPNYLRLDYHVSRSILLVVVGSLGYAAAPTDGKLGDTIPRTIIASHDR